MRADFPNDCWNKRNVKCRLAPHSFDSTGKCLIPCCQDIFGCVQPVELEVEIQETTQPDVLQRLDFFLNLLFSVALNQFVKELREGCLQLSLHVGVRGELLNKRGTS